MRKFKLIKEYPNSGKLGTIKEWDGKDVICFNMPEYPEFWEEIKEQEFEILEFISKQGGKLTFSNMFNLDLLPIYLQEGYKISKIRRLSDNEVFSLGDRVTYNYKANYDPWVIDNFFVRTDGKVLARSKSNSICEIISEIEKVPKPLFVTEDGVEVINKDTEVKLVNPVTLASVVIKAYQWDGTRKVFFFEKNARKYIEQNKPIYSKKQIKEALDTTVSPLQWYDATILRQKLKL